MRSGELQGSKGVSFRSSVIIFAGLLVVFLFGQPALQAWRNSFQVEKQREWIRKTVLELAAKGRPSTNEIQSGSLSWMVGGYLVFSNGWAAYSINTIHDENSVGDIALLRLSDGRYFSSGLHYCGGLTSWMKADPREGAPVDAQEFFDMSSKTNAWNLLSQVGRIQCAVFCPDADRERKHKKVLWISIYTSINGSETNLFERRYVFSGKFLSWKTHWLSNDDISIEILNRDWPPYYYPDTPPTTLAMLKFHRPDPGSPFSQAGD